MNKFTTVRSLIYFCYLKNSEIGEFSTYNIFLIKKYLHLFNGQRIVKIAVDDLRIDNSHLKNLFKTCDVEIVKNHPTHRESEYLIESIKEIKNKNSITFFAHNKGGSNDYEDDAHKLWMLSMYFFNLEAPYLKKIEKGLNQDKVFSGVLRKTVPCHPWVKNDWHYSGDFFWFHTKKLLEIPCWDNFKKGRFAVENLMGRLVDLNKSMCTFVSRDYNFDTYSIKEWTSFVNMESLGKKTYQKYLKLYKDTYRTTPNNYWLGVRIQKTPSDLMILQDIISKKTPDTIIECGTGSGGSAYYMAGLMDLLKIDGKVISIDRVRCQQTARYKRDSVTIDGKKTFFDSVTYKSPVHPKLELIQSDCLKVDLPKLGKKIMLVLDCDHSGDHVIKELEKFSKLVTTGQYIIVEDTNMGRIDNNGSADAVKKFLNNNKKFVADKGREKYGISNNSANYLLKIS